MKDEPVPDKVDESEKQLTEEEQKEKKESLWASFKKDVDSVSIAKPTASASVTTAAVTSVVACAPEVKTVIKEYEFAGEKVKYVENNIRKECVFVGKFVCFLSELLNRSNLLHQVPECKD